MKKPALILLLLSLSAVAFGQGFSAGGGLSLGDLVVSQHFVTASSDIVINYSYPSLGAHAFLDLRYALFDAGLAYGFFEAGDGWSQGEYQSMGGVGRCFLWFEGSLAAKYPLSLGAWSLFPFAGIEYRQAFVTLDAAGAAIAEFDGDSLNGLFIKAGLGADFPLKGGPFLRTMLYAGYRPYMDASQSAAADGAAADGASISVSTWFFRAEALLGWRF